MGQQAAFETAARYKSSSELRRSGAISGEPAGSLAPSNEENHERE
jgi:hypothetical protein